MNDHTALIAASGLTKQFAGPRVGGIGSPRSVVRAVDSVSFEIAEGETFSLVGETGCGKSTTARMLLLVEQPTSGNILFEGQSAREFSKRDLRRYRASVQAVFQDPWSSLNPRMRIRDIVAEPLRATTRATRQEVSTRVAALLDEVGLGHAGPLFPHELSGGQRQRVAIARALAPGPRLIVLDEPVSALDVSIRAQVMNTLKDLQRRHGVSYLLIAHHLATVSFLSDRLGVMYLGKIVETGPVRSLLTRPEHPYTAALISASLSSAPETGRPRQHVLTGEIPSPANPPRGCTFHTRCWLRRSLDDPAICLSDPPPLRAIGTERAVACHFPMQGHDASIGNSVSIRESLPKPLAPP